MSPVISINTPMQNRPGTVGRLLPGLSFTLEAVPGIQDGGLLALKGPNIMLGYLKADQPGVLQPPADGWYDTGDIVAVDSEGFISIKGRQKRFAKNGRRNGLIDRRGSQCRQALERPQACGGEYTGCQKRRADSVADRAWGATRDELLRHFRAEKIAELAIPKKIIAVQSLPTLGTGKADYQKAKAIAVAEMEAFERVSGPDQGRDATASRALLGGIGQTPRNSSA